MSNIMLTSGKSLMQTRNSNRPSTEPSGTPVDIGNVFDLCQLNSTY